MLCSSRAMKAVALAAANRPKKEALFRLSSASASLTGQHRLFSTQLEQDQVRVELNTPFKGHRCDVPDNTAVTNKDEMLEFYQIMQTSRRMEIVSDNLYKQRLIRGFCHLYDGQEAVAVGMYSALDKDDYTITAYRDHVHQLLVGDTLESIFAELLGRRSGCSKGKGGSMHLYYPKGGFFGGNGIVGAQVPLGAGLAFSSMYRDSKQVAVAAYGDGAANQGQLFEASNMAGLWNLPIIFMCENNKYGMGTSSLRGSASNEFYTRGDYIPGIQVDGMDVLAVREAVKWAADWCRSGKGPLFMEMKTYRYHGHSMSDPGISYRSRDEVSSVRAERDCIAKVKKMILDHSWATEAEIKDMDKTIKKKIDAAVKVAKADEELAPEELYTDILASGPPSFIRYPDLANSKRH